ncbi:IS66 family transposase, partial [Methylobacterium aquaticum]
MQRLSAENGQLRAENRVLRDEIARLKGLPPRPPTRQTASGMEKATGGGAQSPGGVRRRGSVQERCALTREVVLSVATPPGSQFKGYQDVVVRDLVLEACVTRYRRERWRMPSGETLVAPLPTGVA